MSRYRNFSIRSKVIFFIFMSTASISILFSYYDYTQKKTHLTQELDEKANRAVRGLASNLVVPLWEIDSNWVDEIVMTEMLDSDISGIVIEGDGGLLVGKQWDEKDQKVKDIKSLHGAPAFIIKYEKIMREDEQIGYISLHVTDKYLKEELLDDTLAQVFGSIMLVLVLSAVIYLVLDKMIIIPMKLMLHVVNRTSQNDYTNKVDVRNSDEVGELATGLNKMIDSIIEKEEMLITQSRHAAMGEMISMIAHQWRQPITVIAMSANSLKLHAQLDSLESEKVNDIASKVLIQTEHLSKTIDDFRHFFSPNKKKEMRDINDIIEETLQVVGKSLENHNIIVEKKYESTSEVLLYSRELLQVVINIINNAKEALIENRVTDPKITIDTKEDMDNIHMSICNNGLPIPEEIRVKVFDPYFSTKNQKNGTGLGLHMSKTIIEKHLHGRIRAHNLQEGVCFNITIPKKAEENGKV